MGPSAAVNAVYAGKIATMPDAEREDFIKAREAEYEEDVDLLRLASELVVDSVIQPSELRTELNLRLLSLVGRSRSQPEKRHGVRPV
jgi:acetyl-CoA carboxylase carboxyltransferase component